MSIEGGSMVGLLGLVGFAAGLLAAIPYPILLLLPSQSWLLSAADGYSHYLTLAVGLWGTSMCVDLGRDALPVAQPSNLPEKEPGSPEVGRGSIHS
jgi:hypothetical protein